MGANSESPEAKRGGEYIYDALVDAGIELLVGLPGTQTLPLDRVVADRDEIDYVMARHETSIPHIAWGYYEASKEPAATLTVPGPGDTNVMHGLKNAYDDCVPLIHISADANPEDRGKAPIHEIEPDTYDNVVKTNINVGKQVELTKKVERAVETALTEPYGPVRLGVPSGILEATFEATPVTISPESVQYDNTENYADAARELAAAERPVVYVGGGARRSPNGQDIVVRLAEELDAPAVTSYKGKGVFPEDDPRFAGVTAKHLPPGAVKMLKSADVVLALGTDFDGVTTANWSLPMGDTLVHVNLDVDDINAGYQADIPIIDDVGHAGAEILARIQKASDRVSGWNGAKVGSDIQDEYISHLEGEGLLDDAEISTPSGLRAVREALPRDGIVTTDIGGFRLWAKQVFAAYDQACYITAGSWAGMGVGLPAALGAKAAHPERPVVSLHGDGGLMMCLTELHTAVESDLSIVLVVFNNSDYGVISKSPKIDEYTAGSRFEWSSPDFTAIAEGFGCRGVDVDSQTELQTAVTEGIDADVPTVINVDVPVDEQSVVDASTYESKLHSE